MVSTNNKQFRKEKNIIFVDASSFKGKYKIGLIDKTNKTKHTLALGSCTKDINEAEKYAVLYGLMYIAKRKGSDKYVLMNDCEGATEDKNLKLLGVSLNTKVMWIPREINKADKVAKNKVNKKKKIWKKLKFFMKILNIKKLYSGLDSQEYSPKLDNISKKSRSFYRFVEENISLFPIKNNLLAPLVIKDMKDNNIIYKKGDSSKVIKELCERGLLKKDGQNIFHKIL